MNNLADRGGVIYFDRLIVQTDLSAIEQILEWFRQFYQPPICQTVWLQGQIALIEAFTNVVRHAHATLPQQTLVKVEAGIFIDRLEIRVWDQGAPFDFAQLLDRVEQDYPNPLEHQEHWGATLFKKLRDQQGWKIEYRDSCEGQNCLCLAIEF